MAGVVPGFVIRLDDGSDRVASGIRDILRGWISQQVTSSSASAVACPYQRFAARVSGLASGLALAVRPAGSAEVSGAQGWVLKIVSAKRLETIFGCP